MNKKIKTIWILRIIILVCLIGFWVVFETTSKTNCEVCSFEVKDKELSAEEFFNLYHDECIDKGFSLELPENFTIQSNRKSEVKR